MRFLISNVVVPSLFVLAACKDAPPSPDIAPPHPGVEAAPSAVGSVLPPASPSSTGPADPDAVPFAGTWEGPYDAKRGSVTLPPAVKDKTWIKDDGKSAIGAGTLTLVIARGGEISGSGKGALGPVDVVGTVDGTMLRASVIPRDPTANAAMTGVFAGALKDGAIVGEIRVAGPDASIVRESTITLKRK